MNWAVLRIVAISFGMSVPPTDLAEACSVIKAEQLMAGLHPARGTTLAIAGKG